MKEEILEVIEDPLDFWHVADLHSLRKKCNLNELVQNVVAQKLRLI